MAAWGLPFRSVQVLLLEVGPYRAVGVARNLATCMKCRLLCWWLSGDEHGDNSCWATFISTNREQSPLRNGPSADTLEYLYTLCRLTYSLKEQCQVPRRRARGPMRRLKLMAQARKSCPLQHRSRRSPCRWVARLFTSDAGTSPFTENM